MTAIGTTEDAFKLLRYWRKVQIDEAREVACELIENFGWATSIQVENAMAERELIDPLLGNFWIGVIFNHPQFEWTDKWYFLTSKPVGTNKAHARRPIKIWTFNKNYDPLTCLKEPSKKRSKKDLRH